MNLIPYSLIVTDDSDSYKTMPAGFTGIPIGNHVGAFGVKRKHHIHEGIDIYAPIGCPVMAIEDGEVIAVKPFTGQAVNTPWWRDTYAVFVKGKSGTIVYGEIASHTRVGRQVAAGEIIGVVIPVLKTNKGRPISMLHLELRDNNNIDDIEWHLDQPQPKDLLDPTVLFKEYL